MDLARDARHSAEVINRFGAMSDIGKTQECVNDAECSLPATASEQTSKSQQTKSYHVCVDWFKIYFTLQPRAGSGVERIDPFPFPGRMS